MLYHNNMKRFKLQRTCILKKYWIYLFSPLLFTSCTSEIFKSESNLLKIESIGLIVLFAGIIGVLLYMHWRTSSLKNYHMELEEVVKQRTSALWKQKEEAEKLKERAEQSEKYEEQFLANMSHDIRTPIHAIAGITNILRRNPHPKEQDKYFNAIHESADNLMVILNDILDLSKIEAGKLTIEVEEMDPSLLVQNVIDIMRVKSDAKGIQLTSQTTGDIPDLIIADQVRLNQILINLMSNAIKFTDKGQIIISMNRREGDVLDIAVEDTGIGIPENKLDRIFDTFEQIKDGHTREQGSGLGLRISRDLIELMGGQIRVKSEVSKGSTFTIELPYQQAVTKQAKDVTDNDEHLRNLARPLSGLKILIAEDNEFNVMVIRDDLSFYIKDPIIEIARNGKIAFDKIKSNKFDMVLMDIQMPEMDGYQSTKNIREWESINANIPTPIIAMTASLLKSEIDHCYEAGMSSYIPKPYKLEELFHTMSNEVTQRGFSE